MKHTAKTILALLLAGVMTLSMAACGGDSAYTGDEDDNEVADKDNGNSDTVGKGDGDDTNDDGNGDGDDEEKPLAESQGLEFVLNDTGDSYKLAGIGECTDTVVVIPATYESKPVTVIGYRALAQNSTITRVVIPDGVTTIEGNAFYDCTALESVEFPESVTSIGHLAFSGCESLTSIKLPANVTSLSATFEACHKLKNVTLPANLTTLGERVFNNCHALESIEIPESVTEIDHETFIRCESLKEVHFADKFDGWMREYDYEWYEVSDAAAMAELLSDNNGWGLYGLVYTDGAGLQYELRSDDDVYYCALVGVADQSITNADIAAEVCGYAVTSIDEWALSGCGSLMTVSIPASVTYVGRRVLEDSGSVTSVTFAVTTGWQNHNDKEFDLSDPAANVGYLNGLTSSLACLIHQDRLN